MGLMNRMSKRGNQRWKEFELLITKIQQQVAPDARVRHNHRITGESGRKRQLDVTISQDIGLFHIFIVIECRHYRRPVTIDKLEAFATKLKDVRASQGVMISVSGFDDGAKAVAAQHHIRLLSYREAYELDWKKAFGSESWCKFTYSIVHDLTCGVFFDNQSYLTIPTDSTLYNSLREPVLTPLQVFEENKLDILRDIGIGPFTQILKVIQPLYLRIVGDFRQIMRNVNHRRI